MTPLGRGPSVIPSPSGTVGDREGGKDKGNFRTSLGSRPPAQVLGVTAESRGPEVEKTGVGSVLVRDQSGRPRLPVSSTDETFPGRSSGGSTHLKREDLRGRNWDTEVRSTGVRDRTRNLQCRSKKTSLRYTKPPGPSRHGTHSRGRLSAGGGGTPTPVGRLCPCRHPSPLPWDLLFVDLFVVSRQVYGMGSGVGVPRLPRAPSSSFPICHRAIPPLQK